LPSTQVNAAPQTSFGSHVVAPASWTTGASQGPIGASQLSGPQVVGYCSPSTHVNAAPQTSFGSQLIGCFAAPVPSP
jgi:hypothetical protein